MVISNAGNFYENSISYFKNMAYWLNYYFADNIKLV